MGLWNKMKGVFGRIGGGIKRAYNWAKEHADTIKKAVDYGREVIDPSKRAAYDEVVNKGNAIYQGLNRIIT